MGDGAGYRISFHPQAAGPRERVSHFMSEAGSVMSLNRELDPTLNPVTFSIHNVMIRLY